MSTLLHADPLIDAIDAYRVGLADYNANAPEDDSGANAYAKTSYAQPLEVLVNWSAPATTRAGLVTALQFALEENGLGDHLICDAMIRAALAFLEAEDSRSPDRHIIELGRLFERGKAHARLLNKERSRLHEVWQLSCRSAGLPDIHSKATVKVAKDTGYEAAADAFNSKHSELVKLMKAIHRANATTLEGFAVKVAAIAFDHSDFEVSAPVPTDVAERELYRLERKMAKAVASNAARGVPRMVRGEEGRSRQVHSGHRFEAPCRSGRRGCQVSGLWRFHHLWRARPSGIQSGWRAIDRRAHGQRRERRRGHVYKGGQQANARPWCHGRMGPASQPPDRRRRRTRTAVLLQHLHATRSSIWAGQSFLRRAPSSPSYRCRPTIRFRCQPLRRRPRTTPCSTNGTVVCGTS
jgi:hypothetical protein